MLRACATLTAMLIDAASSLDRLAAITAPGLPVEPVIEELVRVERTVRDALPGLRDARLGAGLVDALDRIRNSSGTLRESLEQLRDADGMVTFDPGFAADDPGWDAWFAASAEIVRDAAASVQPMRSARSV